MLIQEIKDKALRDLANKRSNDSDWDFTDVLEDAFSWSETVEGHEFWLKVNQGRIGELPKQNVNNAADNALEEYKTDFALKDIALASRFSLADLKELNRSLDDVDKVNSIAELASRYKLELNEVLNIVITINK